MAKKEKKMKEKNERKKIDSYWGNRATLNTIGLTKEMLLADALMITFKEELQN